MAFIFQGSASLFLSRSMRSSQKCCRRLAKPLRASAQTPIERDPMFGVGPHTWSTHTHTHACGQDGHAYKLARSKNTRTLCLRRMFWFGDVLIAAVSLLVKIVVHLHMRFSAHQGAAFPGSGVKPAASHLWRATQASGSLLPAPAYATPGHARSCTQQRVCDSAPRRPKSPHPWDSRILHTDGQGVSSSAFSGSMALWHPSAE